MLNSISPWVLLICSTVALLVGYGLGLAQIGYRHRLRRIREMEDRFERKRAEIESDIESGGRRPSRRFQL